MDLLDLFEDFSDDERSIDILETALLEAKNTTEPNEDNVNVVEKKIVTLINKKLDNAETSQQGLHLIQNFSSKISKELFVKYYPHWYSKLMNLLNHVESRGFKSVCQSFGALIKSCKPIHELDKMVSSLHIKQIVEVINKRFAEEKNENLLNLLIVALYFYPQSCIACMGPLRTQENFSEIILSCIDDNSKGLVDSAAKCYSLIVRALERTFVHSSKENTNKFENGSAKCHALHQINLCQNLNLILNELFQDIVTSSKNSSFELQNTNDNKILKLPELPYMSSSILLENYITAENRFRNVCNYLSSLLRIGASAGQKFVQPQMILQTINKGLSINPTHFSKTNDSKKNIALYIIPKLHTALLDVLETFIKSFGQELLQFGLTIQRLILQTLIWTKTFSQKSIIVLRIQAYKILSLWLQQTKFLSGFQLMANEFLIHIENDLSFNKEILMLKQKVQKNTSKNNLEKNKKISDGNKSWNKNINFNCINLSTQVLSTVESILSNGSHQLSQSFYNSIKNIITTLQYEHTVNKNAHKSDKNNSEYHFQLIKTSTTLQTFTHPSSASLAPYAIKNFNLIVSQNDDLSKTKEAYLGLANLRHIVYPAAPTLFTPSITTSDFQPPVSNALQLNESLLSSSTALTKRVMENGNCNEDISKRQKLTS